MTIGILVFIFLGIVAVAAAVGMILSRNTVYSALFLILNFLTVAVNFVILAFIIFMMIKQINRLKREAPPAPAAPVAPPEDIVLLREIRDSLKK